MKITEVSKKSGKVLIKKCHVCGHVAESYSELKKCGGCKKSFLPTNYFGKVHAKNTQEFSELFSTSDEIHEDDLIRGISVLWQKSDRELFLI